MTSDSDDKSLSLHTKHTHFTQIKLLFSSLCISMFAALQLSFYMINTQVSRTSANQSRYYLFQIF